MYLLAISLRWHKEDVGKQQTLEEVSPLLKMMNQDLRSNAMSVFLYVLILHKTVILHRGIKQIFVLLNNKHTPGTSRGY